MYEITIKGNTPAELFANLVQMAAANSNTASAAVPQVPVNPIPVVNPPIAQPPVAAPVAAPAPVASAPVAAHAPAAVPTASPTYTLDELARAGAALAQAGKMQEAMSLLAKYGVQTVNQLKPEQYGAFATELRALGAQI